MKYLLYILLPVLLLACKQEKKSAEEALAILEQEKTATSTDPKSLSIPNSCQLLSEAKIKEIFAITEGSVNIREAKDPGNTGASSCFFKWTEAHVDNAGMFIQISTNPVYDEFPEYISTYIATKLKDGEMTMGSNTPTKFKAFDAGGRPGAYSYNDARYFWSIGNDYLIMLAFNLPTYDEARILSAAEQIAAIVNTNFPKK